MSSPLSIPPQQAKERFAGDPELSPQQAKSGLVGDPKLSPQQAKSGLVGDPELTPQQAKTGLDGDPRLTLQQAKSGLVEDPELSPQQAKGKLVGDLAGVVPASRLERPAAPTASCGIAEVDALTGGLPRGALTEICGPASSGRTSLLLAALAEATRRQELCALVDTTDSFDPLSAAAAGIDLERLLWIRGGGNLGFRILDFGFKRSDDEIKIPNPKSEIPNSETQRGRSSIHPRGQIENRKSKIKNHWLGRIAQALKATDLLLQGGGFGLVAVDLAGVPPEFARRVPLASWFRFRRAVERTATVLLVLEQEPYAKTCASLVLATAVDPTSTAPVPTHRGLGDSDFGLEDSSPGATPTHAQRFRGLKVQVEVVRSRLEGAKKPARSVGAEFSTAICNW